MDYSLCDISFRLTCLPASREQAVARILESLFRMDAPRPSAHGIELRFSDSPEPAVSGETVIEFPGFSAIRTDRGYHLRSRGAYLTVDLAAGRATGALSLSFISTPIEEQRGFFTVPILLLLAEHGLFGLHAGSVAWDDQGFLLVGHSGCGKTTLTGALARSGWQYLGDDTVLLRREPDGIEARSFSGPFHCTATMRREFSEFAANSANSAETCKRLVDVDSLYPGQWRSRVTPQVILFPEITTEPESRLVPMDCTATLVRLIRHGLGLLRSREANAAQFTILGELARSVRGYRLLHGADVHRNPERVSELLQTLVAETSGAANDSPQPYLHQTQGGALHELRSAA